MPYKDPERQRQWEREHREQRNAARRTQRRAARSGHASVSNKGPDAVRVLVARLKKRASDPIPAKKATSGWEILVGSAVVVGVMLFAAFAALNVPPHGDPGPSGGSGNTAT